MPNKAPILSVALVVSGVACCLLYVLSAAWPSGWAWHDGAPYRDDYFMMIVAVYATLGIFLIRAARDPLANASLIWFTVWSSVLHALVMGWQAIVQPIHRGHLIGDVPALLVIAAVLGTLMNREQAATASATA